MEGEEPERRAEDQVLLHPVVGEQLGEALIDTADTADSFFYNWSELTVAPVDWLRVGLVTQRTRAYRSDRDIQRGLIVGVVTLLAGIVLLLAAINQWRIAHFGQLDYSRTMRWVIPGATLTAVGFQTILASFFVSILGMRRK